ncbi:MAG: hypothetical protein ACLQLG_10965 [Thermoguttaceae bacterium]
MSTKRIDAWLAEHNARGLVVRAETAGEHRDLFFRSDRDLWHSNIDNLDFALVALSHYASASGRDLHLRGAVSRSQIENIDEFIQVWSNWRPDLFQRIDFSADAYSDVPSGRELPAVMTFSGGVDASFSLVAHQEKMLGRLSRDIRCGVLVVGWDLKHGDEIAQETAYAKARESLHAFGADCVRIATNWQQDFCPHWTLGFNIGVSAVLQTLSNRYSHGIIAADLSYLQELAAGPHGNHMVVNHLLGSAGFPIITSGGTHSRLQRVGVLAKYPILLKNLRVCYQDNAGGGNCGFCEKCIRTRLELIASGIEPSICFPGELRAEAVSNVGALSTAGLLLFEEILARFPKHHELYAALWDVVARARSEQHAAELADAINQLETCRAENVKLASSLGEMKRSRSWRFTAPLRKLAGVVRRGMPTWRSW